MNTSITVAEAAHILHKDASWIRAGIIEGWLPIGIATRKGKQITSLSQQSTKQGRINYYISPERLEKFIGGKGNENTETRVVQKESTLD